MEKDIEAFDPASNLGIAVMASRMSMRIPVSCHRADASLHAGLRGSKFYLSSVERGSGSDMTRSGKAADDANDFVVRTPGLRQELGPATKSILLSGFAWRERKLSLAVECCMLRPLASHYAEL
jgi:hypothetical protein